VAVDRHQFWQRVTDIDSDEKIRAFSRQQLLEYQKYFVEVRYDKLLPSHERESAAVHTTLLQREIDRRLGTETLSWARIAGIAAIVTALLAAVTLIVQTWFSTVQPANPQEASPMSSLQTPTPIFESPAKAADSSTATPLPQSEVTATP
jgi:hypothetical protein